MSEPRLLPAARPFESTAFAQLSAPMSEPRYSSFHDGPSQTTRSRLSLVFQVALIVTFVGPETGEDCTRNVAVVRPAGTRTEPGTLAIDGSLLDSVTSAPPAGASPSSVTRPSRALPPITFVERSVRCASPLAGVAICSAWPSALPM